MASEQKLAGKERADHVGMWKKNIPEGRAYAHVLRHSSISEMCLRKSKGGSDWSRVSKGRGWGEKWEIIAQPAKHRVNAS